MPRKYFFTNNRYKIELGLSSSLILSIWNSIYGSKTLAPISLCDEMFEVEARDVGRKKNLNHKCSIANSYKKENE